MKNLIKNNLTAAAVVLLLLSGCAKEYVGAGRSGEATITLRLNMPATGGTDTRAIAASPDEDGEGENRIETIDVLALTQKNGEWVYDYQAEDVLLTRTGNSVIVNAKVSEKSTPQQFVILVNASAELTEAAPVRYEKITAIEERLICSAGGGEWQAKNNGSSVFKAFPMYTRTAAHAVGMSNNQIGTYNIFRMVARIDVTLKAGVSNFILEEACLFNYKTAGYVSYGDRLSGSAVTSPAVPPSGDHTGDPIKSPTVFYESDKSNDTRGEILYSIYTFESPAIAGESGRTTGTALVVGGKYDGSGEMSYYRIDLKTTDDASANISSGILRNHSYSVEIQSVGGGGYSTPLDAYLGGSKLSAKITPWNCVNQKVIFDGQYYLKVSEDEFRFRDLGGDVTLTAETDYNIITQGFPAGIYVSVDYLGNQSGWLTIEGGDDGDMMREIKLTIKELGDTPTRTVSSRTAKVKIKAGNMTKIINVRQDLWGGHADILYFDPDDNYRLKIGRWGNEITRTNYQTRMVFTKFGSVIGFTIQGTTWSNSYIKFNPSNYVVGSTANGSTITSYAPSTYNAATSNALPYIPGYVTSDNASNISSSSYHNYINIKKGKGDICQLLGLTAAEIKVATTEAALNALLDARDDIYKGWRLPTARENVSFVGGSPDFTPWITWKMGDDSYQYTPVVSADASVTKWPYYYNNAGTAVTTESTGAAGIPNTGRFPVVTDAYNIEYTQILPTAGYRYFESGAVLKAGTRGLYRSSSSSIDIMDSAVMVGNSSYGSVSYGFAIRCVRPE